MLEKLNRKDFDKMFALIEISFPKDEYRTYTGHKALLDIPEYQVYVLWDDEKDELRALVTVWEFADIAYVEHLAVNPAYRNGGLGSVILEELTKKLGKMICLEVELPEDDMAIRRIGFYERNGFHLNEYPYIQPALAEGQNAIPLLIMTSERRISAKEFETIKNLLYAKVYNVK